MRRFGGRTMVKYAAIRSPARPARIIAVAAFVPVSLTYRRGPRRPDEVTLAGTPMVLVSGQTATASRTSFSIGRPTELPHSLHDPS